MLVGYVGGELGVAEELCVCGHDDGGEAHEGCADRHWEGDSCPGEGDSEDVVAGGPPEVLDHFAVGFCG